MQSRARLAEPRPTYDLAWRGPEGLGGRAVAVAVCLGTGPGAGQSGGGRSAGPQNRGRCLWGKVPSLAKVAAQRRPLRLLALFSSSLLRWCWLSWVCIRALWALANPLPSRPFFFFLLHFFFDNGRIRILDLFSLWYFSWQGM